MKLSRIVLGCTLLALISAPAHAVRIREHFEKTYAFRPRGKLILSNVNGGVSIESWERDQVRIEAEKEVKAGSRKEAERFMREVRILIDYQEDELRIETEYPGRRGGWSFWDLIFGGRPQAKVVYHIMVPEEIDLDIETVNGAINIEEIKGRISTETTNGHIEMHQARGSIEARTTNGHIEAEITEFGEDEGVSLSTTNGGIKIYLPQDIRADVRASTTNGSIRTDFPLEIRGKFTSKRVRGSINGGGGRIELHTTNGGIKILEH